MSETKKSKFVNAIVHGAGAQLGAIAAVAGTVLAVKQVNKARAKAKARRVRRSLRR